MTIRIIFHTGESYFDIIGFDNVKHFINETLDNGILYIPNTSISNSTKLLMNNSIAVPLTSVKVFYELK